MANTCSPVIGVLCIDVSQKLTEIYGAKIKSYIAASYVKFLESSGARVVPIWIGRTLEYYEEIMSKINGLLIPGGAVFFDVDKKVNTNEFPNDCVLSSKYIYDIAEQKNLRGEYFPIWGTCLGFELLLLHSAQGIDCRQMCEKMDESLPVTFEEDFRNSKMFEDIDDNVVNAMKKQPFAYHYHRYCITKDNLVKCKIDKLWRVLATNKDSNDLEFISLVEHRRFPFFGAQFHPERVCFEYLGDTDKCKRNLDCVKASQYLANFFVDDCRKNKNKFTSFDEEINHLIFNYAATFTGVHGLHWMMCYLFEADPT